MIFLRYYVVKRPERREENLMSGINLRIHKLFGEKRNLVISALDHTMEYGAQPGIEDPNRAISRCLSTDALLLSRTMLKSNWELFAEPKGPLPIVRLNWTSAFYYPLNYRRGYTTIATRVEEAVQSGAHAVIFSLFLENDDEEMETNNVSLFSEVVRRKEELGIPLIGECYVVEHAEKTVDEVHEKVKRVTRVMTELGADLIKCFYTGERFPEIVENTQAPIFTIGAEKLNTDVEVLRKAHASTQGGARGIIFGRNIFMAQDPPALIAALNDVINRGVVPEDAAAKHNLS